MITEEISLKHEFFQISAPDGSYYYGGRQELLPKRSHRAGGCGLIACANVLCYLARFHSYRGTPFDATAAQSAITLADFNGGCERLARGILRPIPHFGLTGLALAWGLNRRFRKAGIPYRARWCARKAPMWARMEAMLGQDLPVIFAVGPNLRPWRKAELTFYRKAPDGTYRAATKTYGHFITVTAMDATWLRISSWGHEYYINRAEYARYSKKHSCSLFCNLLLLERI